MELGVFSTRGDGAFFFHLSNVISTIKEKTGLAVEIRKIQNGMLNYVADFEASYFSSLHDYAPRSSVEQWFSQEPLGLQTNFQFELDELQLSELSGDMSPLSVGLVEEVLKKTFQVIMPDNSKSTDTKVYDDIGEGCLISAFGLEGSAILLWDGRGHINVDLFTYRESMALHKDFEKEFLSNAHFLKTAASDKIPRGYGRVVNFKEDLGLKEAPSWRISPADLSSS